MTRRCLYFAVAGICGLAAATLADDGIHPRLADYQALLEWRFSTSPIMVPADGLHWQLDTAEWHLDSGEIWPQRPTSEGQVTGFVFKGSGRFQMTVPDPVELRQLRRFAKDPELDALAETFDALVVRGVGLSLVEQWPSAAGSTYTPNPLAKDRHEHWLALRRYDVDARILLALERAEDSYIRIDMRTRERSWLTYDFDAWRDEEIAVEWFNPAYDLLEHWLSLDRPEDRDPDGRPTGKRRAIIDIDHLEITADLTRLAKESPQGVAKIRPTKARIDAAVRFQALTSGDHALELYLHPLAEVDEITDDLGNALAHVRDHLGKRSTTIDNKIYDDSLVVLLDHPLVQGETRTLHLSYELEMPGYAVGRIWYPSTTPPGVSPRDLHTARLTLTCRDNYAVRAMGRLEQEQLGNGMVTTTWSIERPVGMMTFVFAKRHHEEIIHTAGVPEVAAFSSLGGYVGKERIADVGTDVAASLGFFQEIFDSEVAGERLQVALIPAAHGQAFDGLIHIGDFSVVTDRVAEQELFRSHEVAHLWWGHQVGWLSYRDQWLSEGFAEYSAMMFVEANLDKGPKYFDEMLAAFSDELLGSIGSTFSQFSRPGVPLLNMQAADRIGPIGHGRRSFVGEAPTAYYSQIYKKGALVLHMLRMLLRATHGSDDAFFEILHTYSERYAGGFASTADFQAIVEEIDPPDWQWFFDAWVYGAEIPTYLWSYDVAAAQPGYVLRLQVEQRDVSRDFKMAIPLSVEFEDGPQETLLAFIDQPAKDFEFALDEKPRKVIFNPDFAVLARSKQR